MSNCRINTFSYTGDSHLVKFTCEYICENDGMTSTITIIKECPDMKMIFLKDGEELNEQYFFIETPKEIKDFVEKIGFFDFE